MRTFELIQNTQFRSLLIDFFKLSACIFGSSEKCTKIRYFSRVFWFVEIFIITKIDMENSFSHILLGIFANQTRVVIFKQRSKV